MPQLREVLENIYHRIEEAVLSFMDWLEDKGIPVYKIRDALEEKGVPFVPLVLAIGSLIVLLPVALIFGPKGVYNVELTLSSPDVGPLAGAQVSLISKGSGKLYGPLIADEQGRVVFEGIPAGKYELRVVYGKQEASKVVVINKDKLKVSLAEIKRPLDIVLTFVDKKGRYFDPEYSVIRIKDTLYEGKKVGPGKVMFYGLPNGTEGTLIVQYRGREVYRDKLYISPDLNGRRVTVDVIVSVGYSPVLIEVRTKTGSKLAGALVKVLDKVSETVVKSDRLDSKGTTSITLPDGEYIVEVYSKYGRYREQRTLKVPDDDKFVILVPTDSYAFLVTVSTESGSLEGATVNLYQGKSLVKSCITDEEGTCFFEGLSEGKYFISAHAPGRVLESKEVEAGKDFEVSFYLKSATTTPYTKLRIYTQDVESGLAVKDAKVVIDINGKILFIGKTNESGAMDSPELPLGVYTISAYKGDLFGKAEFDGTAGGYDEITIDMQTVPVKVTFLVVDPLERPINGAEICAYFASTDLEIGCTTTDENGKAVMEIPSRKGVKYVVTKDGFNDHYSDVVTFDKDQTVTVKLLPFGFLSPEEAPRIEFVGLQVNRWYSRETFFIPPGGSVLARFRVIWTFGKVGTAWVEINSDEFDPPYEIAGIAAQNIIKRRLSPYKEKLELEPGEPVPRKRLYAEIQVDLTDLIGAFDKNKTPSYEFSVEIRTEPNASGEIRLRYGASVVTDENNVKESEVGEVSIPILPVSLICKGKTCIGAMVAREDGTIVSFEEFHKKGAVTNRTYALGIVVKGVELTRVQASSPELKLFDITQEDLPSFSVSGEGSNSLDVPVSCGTDMLCTYWIYFKTGQAGTATINLSLYKYEEESEEILAPSKSKAFLAAESWEEEFFRKIISFKVFPPKKMTIEAPDRIEAGTKVLEVKLVGENGEPVEDGKIVVEPVEGNVVEDVTEVVADGNVGKNGIYPIPLTGQTGIIKLTATAWEYAPAEKTVEVYLDILDVNLPQDINLVKGLFTIEVPIEIRNTGKAEIYSLYLDYNATAFSVDAELPSSLRPGERKEGKLIITYYGDSEKYAEDIVLTFYGETELGQAKTERTIRAVYGYEVPPCIEIEPRTVEIYSPGVIGDYAPQEDFNVMVRNRCGFDVGPFVLKSVSWEDGNVGEILLHEEGITLKNDENALLKFSFIPSIPGNSQRDEVAHVLIEGLYGEGEYGVPVTFNVKVHIWDVYSALQVEAPDQVYMVRNSDTNFKVVVKNVSENLIFKGIELGIGEWSGEVAPEFVATPSSISELGPKKDANFTVKLRAGDNSGTSSNVLIVRAYYHEAPIEVRHNITVHVLPSDCLVIKPVTVPILDGKGEIFVDNNCGQDVTLRFEPALTTKGSLTVPAGAKDHRIEISYGGKKKRVSVIGIGKLTGSEVYKGSITLVPVEKKEIKEETLPSCVEKGKEYKVIPADYIAARPHCDEHFCSADQALEYIKNWLDILGSKNIYLTILLANDRLELPAELGEGIIVRSKCRFSDLAPGEICIELPTQELSGCGKYLAIAEGREMTEGEWAWIIRFKKEAECKYGEGYVYYNLYTPPSKQNTVVIVEKGVDTFENIKSDKISGALENYYPAYLEGSGGVPTHMNEIIFKKGEGGKKCGEHEAWFVISTPKEEDGVWKVEVTIYKDDESILDSLVKALLVSPDKLSGNKCVLDDGSLCVWGEVEKKPEEKRFEGLVVYYAPGVCYEKGTKEYQVIQSLCDEQLKGKCQQRGNSICLTWSAVQSLGPEEKEIKGALFKPALVADLTGIEPGKYVWLVREYPLAATYNPWDLKVWGPWAAYFSGCAAAVGFASAGLDWVDIAVCGFSAGLGLFGTASNLALYKLPVLNAPISPLIPSLFATGYYGLKPPKPAMKLTVRDVGKELAGQLKDHLERKGIRNSLVEAIKNKVDEEWMQQIFSKDKLKFEYKNKGVEILLSREKSEHSIAKLTVKVNGEEVIKEKEIIKERGRRWSNVVAEAIEKELREEELDTVTSVCDALGIKKVKVGDAEIELSTVKKILKEEIDEVDEVVELIDAAEKLGIKELTVADVAFEGDEGFKALKRLVKGEKVKKLLEETAEEAKEALKALERKGISRVFGTSVWERIKKALSGRARFPKLKGIPVVELAGALAGYGMFTLATTVLGSSLFTSPMLTPGVYLKQSGEKFDAVWECEVKGTSVTNCSEVSDSPYYDYEKLYKPQRS